ncbi:MAG: putative transferase match [Frankiales bacterium]|nr:putative transferase match [Frankiales bacterium]
MTAPAEGAAHDVPAGVWRAATGSRKPWLVAALRPFGRLLFRGAFRLTVLGTENVPASGAVLLAGNHTGFLDGPLVWAFSPRPATFLTKSELFVGPLGRALGWLGQVPVHRGRPDRRALHAALAVLRDGGAMGVFPEGTRGAGVLESVSDGLAWLALRSRVPVVPIAVLGTAQAMPKGQRPRLRAPVTLAFGPPVSLTTAGDPRVRRTVRAAGEELRIALLRHLEASSGASSEASSEASSVEDSVRNAVVGRPASSGPVARPEAGVGLPLGARTDAVLPAVQEKDA